MKTIPTLVSICILFALPLVLNNRLNAQSACPNADFINGNFASWNGNTGNYNNPSQTPGIVAGRHTVFTAPAVDPFTCGGLNVIPPAGTTSARLGNSGTGAQAEQLLYTLSVTAQNALFLYKYAVVLENPSGHMANEQPGFGVRILNASGTAVGGACGAYNVYGGQPGQNFQNCGGVTWLPWTTVGIDLSAYIGQNIIIEFTTKDCSLTGHFGYAYIAAQCAPLALNDSYCAGAPTVTLTAPAGFQQYTWNPGNIVGQQVTIPAPGGTTIYTCTMTTFSNQGNCQVVLNDTITPTTVVAKFGATTVCVNDLTQFSDSSTVNSGAITSWQWTFGDGFGSSVQHPSHNYITAGSFQATLISTSDQGCIDTFAVSVSAYALPNVQFTSNGQCQNGLVQFTNLSTDIFPLSYSWDFTDGSPLSTIVHPTHTFASSASFPVQLTATNTMGCSNLVVNPTVIFPTPTVNAGFDQNVCAGNNVVLMASGASTYVWDNGVTNGVSFQPTQNQIYTVIGTDINGCQASDIVSITFLANPVVNAGPDQISCDQSMITLNGSGAVIYEWNQGAYTNGVAFPTTTGTATYTLIGTDANGCTALDSLVVTTHALPQVQFTTTGNCATVAIGFTNQSSDVFPLVYSWNFGDASATSNLQDPTHIYAAAGTYGVQLTATNSMGCVNQITNPVTIDALPVVNAGADVSICQSNTTTLIASGATTYVWDNGVVNGVAFQPTQSGMYTVIGTDANGCQATDNLVLNFFGNPVVNAGLDQNACNSGMVTLTGSGATTYAWNNGVTDGVAFSTSTGSITYTVTGTDGNGCSSTDMVIVTTHALPTAQFIATGNCAADNIVFTNQSNDVFPLTYAWDFADGSPTSSVQHPTHVFTNAMNYGVNLTVTNSMGCVSVFTSMLNIDPLPIVNAGTDALLCSDGTTTLTATGATTYSWDNGVVNGVAFQPTFVGNYTVIGTDGNGCSATDVVMVSFYANPAVNAGPDQALCDNNSVILTASGASTYVWNQGIVDGVPFNSPIGSTVYTVVGTDANGCKASDDVTVTIFQIPTINAGIDQLICQGQSTILTATGGMMYAWTNGVINTQSFVPTSTTTYVVTGTSSQGCSATDEVTVMLEAPIALNVSVNTAEGCAPLSVTFTNTSIGGVNCNWEFSDGESGIGCSTVDHVFENEGCYAVTFSSTSAIGCVSDTTIPNVVCVFPRPNAAFEPSPYVLSELNPVTTMNNNSSGAVDYTWDFGDNSSSVLFEPTHTYPEVVTSYTVTLIAVSDHGCRDTTDATITIQEELVYYVPNAFTPDGSGVNEVFLPRFESGFDPESYRLYIFNRWGETVFETQDYQTGWDGSFAGKIAQDGTYTWKIEFKSRVQTSSNGVITGHVSILK